MLPGVQFGDLLDEIGERASRFLPDVGELGSRRTCQLSHSPILWMGSTAVLHRFHIEISGTKPGVLIAWSATE